MEGQALETGQQRERKRYAGQREYQRVQGGRSTWGQTNPGERGRFPLPYSVLILVFLLPESYFCLLASVPENICNMQCGGMMGERGLSE